MEQRIVKLKRSLLVCGDVVVLYTSLWLAVWLRGAIDGGARFTFSDHVLPYSFVFALWLAAFSANGLYDLSLARNNLRFVRVFTTALGVGALLAIGFFYLTPVVAIAPKTTLLLHLAVFAALFVLWRIAANAFFSGALLRIRVLFVGENEEIRELVAAFRENPALGYDVAGVILDAASTWQPDGIPVLGRGFAELPAHIRNARADLVVLGVSPRSSPDLARHLYESIFLKTRFVDSIPFAETITRRVPVASITHVWFLENLREAEKRATDAMKRCADILLAALGGLACLAILPPVLLAMLALQGRPLLFTQLRVGRGGKPFKMVKLRSMVRDAEKDGAQFAEAGDKRVTPVGRFLRATRIDEMPQLWNVLVGEMSMIGPRPERPEFVAELERAMPFYAMRHLIRPGLTGWAQIEFPYASTIEQNLKKLQYDLYYIKHRSMILDAFILLRTVRIILGARGQ
ncbi:sugar transferase [Patescibacteria group bacterium]|nr:MAG: sugar transferase [Patescibacteria group bacterium]